MKRVLILSLLTLGITTLAHAQATRTWVSGVGDDVNPCSRTAPCKTFAGAISKTASPGIINCLDPGGFGAVTITKSIAIDCTGTLGSVLSSGVQGIVINALTTNDIILRNIDISGAGTTLGTNGINVIQARSVSIEGVSISQYSGQGVRVSNTSNAIPVHISNSDIRLCVFGVVGASTAPGVVGLDIRDSKIFQNSNTGVDLGGANNGVTLTRCVVTNNQSGVVVEQTTSVGALESNTIAANQNGVVLGTGGGTPTIRFSRNLITGNTANGLTGGGTSKCFGNNVIDGNSGTQTCTQVGQTQQ
ncbi:MAG TPA: right-handed parallel beta-helix repeat-containing protein [Thermoanaerobaculia bacterium]|nr:right-handed parallel beta-helix repeat-containing protein [Thermoanaerobaculia bacterium]